MHKSLLLAVSALVLGGCVSNGASTGFAGMGGLGYGGMGGGGMGTEYGTGGMYLGTNLGGWGDGYGGTWGHAPTNPALASLDNDPHVASSYQNPMFSGGRGVDYYHPAASGGAPPP